MSELNLNVVRSLYDAFESRDLPAVMQHLAEDVQVFASEGVPWSGTYYGPDGFEAFIDAVEEHLRLSFETDELFASGESVAQIGATVGQVHATGTTFWARSIHVWRLREGKVISFQNYPDTRTQRLALGLPLDDDSLDSEATGRPGPGPFWG
jgi:hypothetical protein